MCECVLEEVKEVPLFGRSISGEGNVSPHEHLELQALAVFVDAFLLQVHARTSVSNCW